MESVLGRYRNLIILVGVLFLQVLGLAVQVKRNTQAEHTTLIRIWAVDAITPFERGVVWIETGTSNLWHNYVYLRGVRAENRDLKEEIEQMRLQEVRLSEDAAQARRLQSLLSFKEQFIGKTVAAQVIGASGSDLFHAPYIDKGSEDGVKPDMAVITADGIVGKVLHVYPSTSQILLINDQSSGVGVILEKSRLQGGLRGTPNGQVILEHIMSDEDVKSGDRILTSGGDQIFPKGLPVGMVGDVKPGKDTFLDIRVKPYANLSKLEEVLVVTEKLDRQPVAEDSHIRAADILAQRLPSVPDSPPGDAKPTTTTNMPGGSTATKPPVAVKHVATEADNDAAGTPGNASTTPKPAAPKPVIGTAPATQNPGHSGTSTLPPPASNRKPLGTAQRGVNSASGNKTPDFGASVAAHAAAAAKTLATQPKPAQSTSTIPASDETPH